MLDAAAIIQMDIPQYTVTTETEDSSGASDRRARLSANPKRAAALQRARQRISREINDDSIFSIAKLRLNAGLSQAELAKIMDTQQPAIARMEKGAVEPKLSTMEKLAEVLGVSVEVVVRAFINTRKGS